jgi:hypothetical protein
MTANGTVIASLLAGVAHDAANNPSLASTSTDNTVTFSSPDADFDSDGDVDGRDFLAWQRGYGIVAPNAGKANGDADDDTDVDGDDLGVWQDQYGTVPGPVVALSAVSAPLVAEEAETKNEITSSPATYWIDSAVERETASTIVADEDVQFVESFDRAFDELSTVPMRSVRGFGEMVSRRGAARAATLMVFEKAL